MCVDVGLICIEEAHDQLQNQNKTLQHDFYLVIYIITMVLSFL